MMKRSVFNLFRVKSNGGRLVLSGNSQVFAALILVSVFLAVRASAEKCDCADGAKDETSSVSELSSDTNHMCPVMPDEVAEDAWTTVYQGKLVRFCCNNCVDNFRLKPEKYLSALPQFAAPEQMEQSWSLSQWISPTRFRFLLIMLCTFGVATIVWKLQSLRVEMGQKAFISPLVVNALLGFSVATIVYLSQYTNALKMEMLKQEFKHGSSSTTYADYGYPPVPTRPDIQPAFSHTFYRGNDERSSVLYNGGNYQTAIFHIELKNQDGSSIKIGDKLPQSSLQMNFAIERAKNSPARMFSPKLMDNIYLSRNYEQTFDVSDTISDKVPLTNVDPETLWEASFDLGIAAPAGSQKFDPATVTISELARIEGITKEVATWFVRYRDAGYPITGVEDLRQAGITGVPAQILSASLSESRFEGVVNVCEAKIFEDRQLGARLHYGIKYDIKVENGRLAEGSEVWMGSLSRSEKAAKGAIPDEQWLHHKPLPELPEAQDISDELLGIDDYAFQ